MAIFSRNSENQIPPITKKSVTSALSLGRLWHFYHRSLEYLKYYISRSRLLLITAETVSFSKTTYIAKRKIVHRTKLTVFQNHFTESGSAIYSKFRWSKCKRRPSDRAEVTDFLVIGGIGWIRKNPRIHPSYNFRGFHWNMIIWAQKWKFWNSYIEWIRKIPGFHPRYNFRCFHSKMTIWAQKWKFGNFSEFTLGKT